MRFQPGAVLPDHEHVNIEQTYVLEGSLVDKEGPAKGIECKAGEFVWREQGSRHVAWCPEGGLMLAIFQVPNKFFEADGRVVDARARTGTRPGGIPARGERGSRSALADKGQGGARPHSVSYAGLTRVCINLRESLANKMDCRVKPGRRVSPRQVRRSHQKLIDGAGAEAPSRIAHTTSDWPRRMSPAVNTFGSEV